MDELTYEQRIGSASLSTICIMSVMLNLSIVGLMYRKHMSSKSTPVNVWLVSLFSTDGLLGIVDGPIFLYNAINGRWTDSTCHTIAVTSVMFCCQSVLTLTFIALERYFVIVRKRKFPTEWHIPCMAFCWILSFCLGSMSVFDSDIFPYGPSASGFFCVGHWFAPGLGTMFPVVAISILFTCLTVTAYLYRKIYVETKSIREEM